MVKITKLTFMVCCFVCAISTVSQAQMQWGVRANFRAAANNAATETFKDPIGDTYQELTYLSTSAGYSYGLATYGEFGNLWLMGESLFKRTQVHYQIKNLRSLERAVDGDKVTESYSSISIPVSAGFRVGDFKFGGGPIFNYLIDRSQNLTDYPGFMARNCKLSKGFQFLAGVVIKDHIHVDLKRELSFSASGDEYKFVTKPVELGTHPHTWSLSIGVFL